MSKTTNKVQVTNPITGKLEMVSEKQWNRYGSRYFYNREYDRIRKSKVLTDKDKTAALREVKRVEHGERVAKERISETYIKARKKAPRGRIDIGTKSKLSVKASERRITNRGTLDERSGLTMLALGNRQKAYDTMLKLEEYGLGTALKKLHEGEYQYMEVVDNEIYANSIEELKTAYETDSIIMEESTYKSLTKALKDLIS